MMLQNLKVRRVRRERKKMRKRLRKMTLVNQFLIQNS
jgi:hypothetical protein